MIKLTVDGKEYSVEFRHVTKLGKRAQLYSRSPIKAITTCAIVAKDFVAIDNAICAEADNFSRAVGRDLAFAKVLGHCGALKNVKDKFIAAYHEATVPGDPPETRPQISDEERQARIAAGAEVREKRLKLHEAKA